AAALALAHRELGVRLQMVENPVCMVDDLPVFYPADSGVLRADAPLAPALQGSDAPVEGGGCLIFGQVARAFEKIRQPGGGFRSLRHVLPSIDTSMAQTWRGVAAKIATT